ncbi:MAG: hypothetical protein CVT49_06185 [candidate division Zixibacteria bacterium HGW-Zixibacteria-1]|nr:MAG: hypothetical protein CVT49_06185 [candidate division Zixibacteria bacterium HGW-Zixibacteria-1]
MTTKKQPEKLICPICSLDKPKAEVRSAYLVHGPVGELIRKQHPDWDQSHVICNSCLNSFRAEYVEDILEGQRGDLSTIENTVIDSLKEQEVLSKDVNEEFNKELTLGRKWADKVASFGGSWNFISIFAAVLFIWILINSIVLLARPFDPYPFILLNLVLSCLAAIQAPVIMMSQNRQEAKDRLRAEHDYQVNLKAEIEIRHQLINHFWQRLLEIQQIQTDLMRDLTDKSDNKE